MIEHGDPARSRTRSPCALPEADVDLAERPSPEVKVGQLERGGLVSSKTSVIKRPEEGIVTPSRAELACSCDADFQELEELLHAAQVTVVPSGMASHCRRDGRR